MVAPRADRLRGAVRGNNTQYDDYGSTGNYNPHTGRYGTRQPKR